MAVLGQAVVTSESRVHQPTAIRAGDAAKVNIAAVTVDQGVARLLQNSGPDVNIATVIVNATKRYYVTDKEEPQPRQESKLEPEPQSCLR